MKAFTTTLILIGLLLSAEGQEIFQNELFASQEVLNIRLETSLKTLRKKTNDSTYMDGVLHYERGGVWDSVEVKLRRRGHFRLDNCFFTPIRIKIKKKKAKGSLFEGNKPLKLVLPCERGSAADPLVIKEFMCYKFYEKITPYTFSTRLVNLELQETSKNKVRTFNLTGFLIEDDDIVAKRHKAEIHDKLKPHPLNLHDTTAYQHALFQYLIGNLDWSTAEQHNAKIMITRAPMRYIPLAYDFDHSGFVNAPYAKPPPQLEVKNVTDRLYRGFCRNNDKLAYHVRDQYLNAEKEVRSVLSAFRPYFNEEENKEMQAYIDKFYAIISDKQTFKEEILNNCRTE